MEIVTGKILEIKEDGGAVISTKIPSIERAILRKYDTVEVAFCDGRCISPKQRKKIYALINEIAEWMGDYPESTKNSMKLDFKLNRLQGIGRKMFSLSDVDMTTAREFITYLVDFVIEHDVPTRVPLKDMADDIGRYVYSCLMNKKCCLCGDYADLHHYGDDKIGMGNDRQEVHHLGRKCLPLCRKHHTEAHNIGDKEFAKLYHLQPVEIDENICKKYKLKK